MIATAHERLLPVAPIVLDVGDRLPEDQIGPLTRTDFVRYAGAGGDLNAIHHDEALARAAGMPSVFGMGMLHAGMLGVRLARWVGPNNIRTFAVRFTGKVWPDDVLTFTGQVDAVAVTADEALATLTLAVTRQGDDRVLEATATVVAAGRNA